MVSSTTMLDQPENRPMLCFCNKWSLFCHTYVILVSHQSRGRGREAQLKSLSVGTYFAFAAVLVVAVSVSVFATGAFLKSQHAAGYSVSQLANEARIAEIYAKASPAVVQLRNVPQIGYGTNSSTQGGQGSGFLIDKEGDIVTNAHVVDNATSVQVIFGDGRTFTAAVVGRSLVCDLAVVKVDDLEVSSISPLELADSGAVKPGQAAIALGSPYGLTNSIALGIISGLGRSIVGGTTGMIQTDANIQPGDSGGPLLDSTGRVVGVNTAMEGPGTGIGFAIPSNVVAKELPVMKATAQKSRP